MTYVIFTLTYYLGISAAVSVALEAFGQVSVLPEARGVEGDGRVVAPHGYDDVVAPSSGHYPAQDDAGNEIGIGYVVRF